jgi:hypothetical protein
MDCQLEIVAQRDNIQVASSSEHDRAGSPQALEVQ